MDTKKNRQPVCLLLLIILLASGLQTVYAQDEDTYVGRADILSMPFGMVSEKLREARNDGMSVTWAAGGMMGYDSNLFRSPSGSRESNMLAGAGVLVKVDKRFDRDNRMQFKSTI